jgi:hypothetical protein
MARALIEALGSRRSDGNRFRGRKNRPADVRPPAPGKQIVRQAAAGILLALTALAAAAPPAARTQADGAMGALEAVVAWRVNWVRDTTAFDACSLYDAAGRPATFPAGIAPRFEHLIQGAATNCGSAAGQVRPTPSASLHLVVIDSMRLGEAQGRVWATIHRGDAVHREDYVLARGRQWSVTEMRTWGAETVSYLRPAACPPANEPTRRVLHRFLTSAGGAPIRVRDGLANVSAANVRLLTDGADSAVCHRLRNGLTFSDGFQRTFAFYEADGFYFVAAVRPPSNDGMIHLGFNPLIVLTRHLKVVGAYTS